MVHRPPKPPPRYASAIVPSRKPRKRTDMKWLMQQSLLEEYNKPKSKGLGEEPPPGLSRVVRVNAGLPCGICYYITLEAMNGIFLEAVVEQSFPPHPMNLAMVRRAKHCQGGEEESAMDDEEVEYFELNGKDEKEEGNGSGIGKES